MKRLLILALVALGALLVFGTMYAQSDTPPTEPLVYEAKTGNVSFDHTKHLAKLENDCTVCHDSLFQQEQSDLGDFGKGMHKAAIKDSTACANCHKKDGSSFDMGAKNCKTCHIKG
jgi:c(7)-type cytochrome triheme protein